MKNTCCGQEFSCQGVRYVNPEYAEQYTAVAEQPEVHAQPERESLFTKLRALASTAMREIGQHDGQIPRIF